MATEVVHIAIKQADPSETWNIVEYSTAGVLADADDSTIQLNEHNGIRSLAFDGKLQYAANHSSRVYWRTPESDWNNSGHTGGATLASAGESVGAAPGLLLTRYPSEAGADNVGQLQVFRVTGTTDRPNIRFQYVESHFGPDGRVPDDYIDIACTKSGGCLAATSAGRLEYWAPKPSKYVRNTRGDRNLNLGAGEQVVSIDLANHLVMGQRPTSQHKGRVLVSQDGGGYRIAEFNYTPVE